MQPFTLALFASLSAVAVAQSQPGTEVTVYNGGFAFVKEIREVRVKQGRQTVMIQNIAQMMDPTSVAIRNLTNPGGFQVLEQNYRYDLINVEAILAKSVGKQMFLNRVLPDGKVERLSGTLLTAPSAVIGNAGGGNERVYNGMVFQTTDGRILLNPSGEIEVTSVPDNLIAQPSLVWDLQSAVSGNQNVELSYLTNGMSWTASYVLSLDQPGKIGDLKGWVTMNNQSGTAYLDAKLKLLAGEVRRVQESVPRRRTGGAPTNMAMDAAKMEEESFADYHLYTLPRPASILNNEIKQLSLLEASQIPIRKRLLMNLYGGFYSQPSTDGFATQSVQAAIQILLTNDEASKMGMPLPAGTIKVYQRDSSGSPQLIGEAAIGHTPKKEKLTLEIGTAFDVVGTHKRVNFEYIRSGSRIVGARQVFELEVRNRKEVPEKVVVMDRHWGQWKVSKSSQTYTKVDAATLQFELDLKAEETKTVTYTVETQW